MAAEPISIESVRKPFRPEGLGYVWDIPGHEIEMRADYLGLRTGQEMHAQVGVKLRGQHLHMAHYNLSSTRSRRELREELDSLTPRAELPWKRMVEQFCVGVLEAERRGSETQYAAAAEKRRQTDLIDYLAIKGKTNMFFAPGGSGKGMLSVAACCALAANRGIGDLTVMPAIPFYFDWEDDFETFQDRLNAVARGMGVEVPQVPYRRMRGLASDRINEIARAIAQEGAEFAVIDSFSAAGGTVSERTSWDSIAHRLFDALDQVPNMTWFIIDHVAGDKVQDPVGKAYGSIQKMNRVRNAWEMRSEQEPGSQIVHMRYFHAKWNHTGKQRPFGLRMEFAGDDVKFYSEDPAAAAQHGAATLADKMALELANSPLSVAMLSMSLNTSEGTIRSELSRNRFRFVRDGVFIRLRTLDSLGDVQEELP